MARLRNISDVELETRVSGRSYVTAPDGVLEIPDDVYLAHAWPEQTWNPVSVPSAPDVEDTVEEILGKVGDDPTLAQAALDAENARSRPRKTLVAALEHIVDPSQEG